MIDCLRVCRFLGLSNAFVGLLLFNVKDVNTQDQTGVLSEFGRKIRNLLSDNKSVNFLTEMYGENLEILCCPPLGTFGYWRALEESKEHMRAIQTNDSSGFASRAAFLDSFRLILAKIAILD